MFSTILTAPAPPTNVIAESATSDNVSSIIVRWDPPNPVPDNLQYKVYFAAVDETGYQPQGEVVFKICDATQTSASITDLSPRSNYQVRVGTVAGVVTEASSVPQVIETPDISKLWSLCADPEERPGVRTWNVETEKLSWSYFRCKRLKTAPWTNQTSLKNIFRDFFSFRSGPCVTSLFDITCFYWTTYPLEVLHNKYKKVKTITRSQTYRDVIPRTSYDANNSQICKVLQKCW